MYAVINDVNDSVLVQEGLNALFVWSDLWPLSLQKCTILHLGRNNTHHNYSVDNVSLPDVTVVTDLGVLVDNNLRFIKHYSLIFNKANHRSSLFLKSFQSINPQLLFRAFTVFVRPLLNYIVVQYGRLSIKLISILLNEYNVVSLNVFLV